MSWQSNKTKELLNATKRIHKDMLLHEHTLEDGDMQKNVTRWRKVVADANLHIAHLSRVLNDCKLEHKVELHVLVDAIKGEMMDYKANQAHVAELFRVAQERQNPGSCVTYDRAINCASSIEAAIVRMVTDQ
jgi:hypothetical protein